jgi:hypothetical protein
MDVLPKTATRCLVIVVAICGSMASLAARQPSGTSSEPQRSSELTARVFDNDQSWQWVPAIDNRPGPFVKSEQRILVGSWVRRNDGGQVSVSIYAVDSLEEAEQWLALHEKGAKDWTIKRYSVGDGGWRAEHPTGQVAISLRRRLYVITVSSKDAPLVERCARQIVLYLDAIK